MLTLNDIDFLAMMGPTLVLFLVGLGVMINGLRFTVPRKEIPQPDLDNLLNEPVDLQPRPGTQNISPPYKSLTSSSVTEHTTHQLNSSTARTKQDS